MKQTHVHSANLKLYKLHVDPETLEKDSHWNTIGHNIRVNIYQLLESPKKGNTPLRRLLDSVLVTLDSFGWVKFDIKLGVQYWLDHPHENFGVEVSCDTHNINDVIVFTSHKTMTEEDVISSVLAADAQPTLNVFTQDRLILGRQKRSALEKHDCVHGDGEHKCCRYPLMINFHEIGWDWVVAPDSFQAYYCDGQCPYMYKMSHKFSGIQALINMMNPDAAPAPCCSAKELSSLTLLHFDEHGELSVTEFTDMIVENCGCS